MFFSINARVLFDALRILSLSFAFILLFCIASSAAPRWSAKLDGRVVFYQATELGVLIAGTEKSLYAIEAETGEVLWRRKDARLEETDVAAVPGTDVLLLSFERGDKTRLEAVDLLTGGALWRSERVRGSVMQMAFEPNTGLLAAVFARDARGRAKEGFKRKPTVRVFDLREGREVWKRELESEVEMMPALVGGEGEVPYTLDNYRAPAFLDGRLYLFYEGVTSLDARDGEERRREKFRVNEEGLALTEADPVADERHVYFSGRGRVRAVARADGRGVGVEGLGADAQMALAGWACSTCGRAGSSPASKTVRRGAPTYGVTPSIGDGQTLWRYKGDEKGITNMSPDASTIVVADRDDHLSSTPPRGKRASKLAHAVERAASCS